MKTAGQHSSDLLIRSDIQSAAISAGIIGGYTVRRSDSICQVVELKKTSGADLADMERFAPYIDFFMI